VVFVHIISGLDITSRARQQTCTRCRKAPCTLRCLLVLYDLSYLLVKCSVTNYSADYSTDSQ